MKIGFLCCPLQVLFKLNEFRSTAMQLMYLAVVSTIYYRLFKVQSARCNEIKEKEKFYRKNNAKPVAIIAESENTIASPTNVGKCKHWRKYNSHMTPCLTEGGNRSHKDAVLLQIPNQNRLQYDQLRMKNTRCASVMIMNQNCTLSMCTSHQREDGEIDETLSTSKRRRVTKRG